MDNSSWRTGDEERAAGPRGRSAAPGPRPLISPTSQSEHARVGKRLLWALPVTLAVMLALILLGPSAEEIERKFKVYGKEGPLRLMPEIAIEDGQQDVHQQLRPQTAPPPGAPTYEVLPEDPLPQDRTPPPQQADALTIERDRSETIEAPADADHADVGASDRTVDLLMPSLYADADFVIRKLVRPQYPPRASIADRQQPIIVVEAAFFLDSEANIVAVMIQSNEGGPEFATAVQQAMEQWEFEPRWRDGKPPAARWLVVTWRFRSPFGATSP